MQEAARNGQSLAHAARKLANEAVAHPIQAGAFQPLAGGAARIVQPIKLAEHVQILERRKLFINPDAMAQDADTLACASGARVLAQDGNAPAPGFREAAQD